jgi:hypothetical protein
MYICILLSSIGTLKLHEVHSGIRLQLRGLQCQKCAGTACIQAYI